MRLFLLLAAATLIATVAAQADGIYVSKDLKHAMDEHTTISLTAKQIRDVERLRVVYLTNEQLKPLQKIYAKTPRKIEVLSSRYDECTCEMGAYAIWCRPGELDIPYSGIKDQRDWDEEDARSEKEAKPVETPEAAIPNYEPYENVSEAIILDSKGWMYVNGKITDENGLHALIDQIAAKPVKAKKVVRDIFFDTPPPINPKIDGKIRDLINRTKAYAASKGVECSAQGMR